MPRLGDILMILDADLTTMPGRAALFYLDAIATGTAEFVNGSRLIYPVPRGAIKQGQTCSAINFSVSPFSYLLEPASQRILFAGPRFYGEATGSRITLVR